MGRLSAAGGTWDRRELSHVSLVVYVVDTRRQRYACQARGLFDGEDFAMTYAFSAGSTCNTSSDPL